MTNLASMRLAPSRILGALREGRLPSILKLNLSDPRVVEIVGLCGADAAWLCAEHVPNDWISLENQIRAARLHGIDSLVRVSRGSYSDYIRPLEAGATGLIVPHVSTADEARQIVEWVRFKPLGSRALDGGNVDGLFCQVPLAEYLAHANSERILILQIESPEGLENVEKIAAVAGFDMLLFGPGDFSHRIGKAGESDVPEVTAARKRIAAAARRHGKFTVSAGFPVSMAELVSEGHQVFILGADVTGLAKQFKTQLEWMRREADALPAREVRCAAPV